MKKAEFYKNEYPLEDLLPELDEIDVQIIVRDCDYTWESDSIAGSNFPDIPQAKVNTADAVIFYTMGYKAAKELIEKRLKAVDINSINK